MKVNWYSLVVGELRFRVEMMEFKIMWIMKDSV